jgi:hypothetical protein
MIKNRYRRTVLSAASFFCGIGLSAEPAGEPVDRFVYTGKSGVSFTVTPAGLTSVTLAGREVIRGDWHAVNGDWVNKLKGTVEFGKASDQSLDTVAPDHARVRHAHSNAVVTYDYTFADEDVTVRMRVENNHPADSIRVTGFQGLQVNWQEVPKGMMTCTHGSWLTAHPGEFFHPSMENKIGGTYGADAGLGVGCSPANLTLLPTITMWDYADWSQTTDTKPSREFLPKRNLQYFVACEIPAGGARTFGLTIRVSGNTDWRHLLQPYKDWFTRVLGPVRYTGDHRPIIQLCANKSVAYITPQNPYGFHDGIARLDLTNGVQQFCDELIPLLKQVNGQGVIIWGQQGTEKRGAEYRPDFDVLPPEVETNWPAMKKRFDEAGLKLGVATRPDSIPTRISWKSDGLVDLDPKNAGHLAMLLARFKTMREKGCSLFYMDCFGMRFEDVELARYLREQLGPEVQLYSEMSCDTILPYVGLYMEINYKDGEGDAPGKGGIMWLSEQQWAVMRWLAPGIVTAVRPHITDKESASGRYYRWMLEHEMTPLEQPWPLKGSAPKLKEMLPQFVDGNGQWIQ